MADGDPGATPEARPRTQGGLPYSRARHLDRILTQRSVQPVYQPIVDLRTREVVAFEALARGPQGTPLERPDLLFATARDLGLVGELDWVCRATAMGGALSSGLGSALTLFVNVEPDMVATRAPDDLFATLKHAEQDLRVVLEVTERSLLNRPAELLHWLSWARDRWWGVALDDVGATSESLALMPFVHPDVIKLDARFVRQEVLTSADRRVLEAVRTQALRTGATILAEGIESSVHLARADELGATLAQGWYFGRPAALPAELPAPRAAVRMLPRPKRMEGRTPWELLDAVEGDRQALRHYHAKRVVHRVLRASADCPEAPLVMACLPGPPGPWTASVDTLVGLRGRVAYVGVVGVGMERAHQPGWQTGPLPATDDMVDEWTVAVIGPHHAEAVVCWDRGQVGADGDPMLEVVSTRDRGAVSAVADHLMRALALPALDFAGRPVSAG